MHFLRFLLQSFSLRQLFIKIMGCSGCRVDLSSLFFKMMKNIPGNLTYRFINIRKGKCLDIFNMRNDIVPVWLDIICHINDLLQHRHIRNRQNVLYQNRHNETYQLGRNIIQILMDML